MKPLTGIRVLDFGQFIAGPLTAMLLAEHGADVIHIDPPGGPRWKHPATDAFNAIKEGLVLNLREAADVNAARRLAAASDVLIENFRPGVMERFGLGAADLLREQPSLLYCSLPGFAADDPRAAIAGWEGVIGAATDTYRPRPGSARPAVTAVPIASTFAAFSAAVAIVMALIARARDGRGQRIEVPLFDATFAAIGAHGLQLGGHPAGQRPDDFWSAQFECADGRWIQVSAATHRFRRRFAEALGLNSWIGEGLLEVDRLRQSTALQTELRSRLTALFATRPAEAWEELAGRISVPIAVCRTTEEWLQTEHAREAEIAVPFTSVRLDLEPDAAWGQSAGRGPAPNQPTADTRAALANLRVLDLTQVLAGPTAGRTLAEYGADVIKINNPNEEGAGYRFSVHRYHTDVNRGKRTMLLDLKSESGGALLSQMLDTADVLLENFRPGVAERLGIGYAALRERRPDLPRVRVSERIRARRPMARPAWLRSPGTGRHGYVGALRRRRPPPYAAVRRQRLWDRAARRTRGRPGALSAVPNGPRPAR
jgi:crotonobetainyl-CoA:carnitine CoA-transferase CaiB-like acyl-CoA transferase